MSELPPNKIQEKEYISYKAVKLDLRWLQMRISNMRDSRYDSDRTPNLYLNDDKPKLNWNYLNNANNQWGAASCGNL